jgi:hypothetical protein
MRRLAPLLLSLAIALAQDWPQFRGRDGRGTLDVEVFHMRGAPLTPSPLLAGDALYVVSDNGIASCLDARSAGGWSPGGLRQFGSCAEPAAGEEGGGRRTVSGRLEGVLDGAVKGEGQVPYAILLRLYRI